MTVAAVSMVKNEQDIVEATVRHMLDECDFVIVADNMSTDDTRRILDAIAASCDRLLVTDDTEPGYYQSAKMTALARQAGEWGADWVIPFDADEWWYSRWGPLRTILGELPGDVMIAEAELYDHVTTDLDDPKVTNPVRRIGWRNVKPAPLPKVAVRWRDDLVIEMGNHGAHYGTPVARRQRVLTVRHFPYRSLDQFVSKARNGAAAYAAALDVDEHYGSHWRGYGQVLADHGVAGIERIYRTWFHRADPTIETVVDGSPLPQLTYDRIVP